MTPGKIIDLTRWIFVLKMMSLLFNTLSRSVIAFLPRSKNLLILWLQWFWSSRKLNLTLFSLFPIYLPWSEMMGLDVMILIFWTLSHLFHSPLLPSPRGFVPLHLLWLKWYHVHIWGCWYFSWHSWFQLVLHPAQYFVWCTLHIS